MNDRIGQQIGNYRLSRLLGQGGFAEVYLGEHIYLKTQAALKFLHGRLSVQDVQDFMQEAKTIAALKHPHIVRVYDFGLEQQMPYIVMDYAPHGTLHDHHPRGTVVPLPQILSYVKQVGAALAYTHEHKLIHRDVKPENMLLDEQNQVQLSDFGIVAIAHRTASIQRQNITGTIRYMAPEQFLGYPTPASDQYSLGILVYEWLCGECPFHGANFIEMGMKHATEPVPSLQQKVPTLFPEVEHVVLKALAKDEKQRFPHIQDFVQELEQATKRNGSTATMRPAGIILQQPRQFTSPDASPLQPAKPLEPASSAQPPSSPLREAASTFTSSLPGSNPAMPVIPQVQRTQNPPLPATVPAPVSSSTPRSPSAPPLVPVRTPPTIPDARMGQEVRAIQPAERDTVSDLTTPPHLRSSSQSVSPETAHRSRLTISRRGLLGAGLVVLGTGAGAILAVRALSPHGSSSGGSTWTRQNSGTSQELLDIVWSGTQFVAVGAYGTIVTSPDGRTWTPQLSSTLQDLHSVAWSGTQFVAVGGGTVQTAADQNAIVTSPDGRTWTSQNTVTSPALLNIVWSGRQFVAVGYSTILTSPNGSNWTVRYSNSLQIFQGLAWSGTQFVTGGSSAIFTSLDGHTWTAQSQSLANASLNIIWSGTQFVAVGSTILLGTGGKMKGEILTSPDGITWTLQNTVTSPGLNGIARSRTQFVATGDGGTILASPDGHTWTLQHSGTSDDLCSVAWSGRQFVAVGNGGAILTSP